MQFKRVRAQARFHWKFSSHTYARPDAGRRRGWQKHTPGPFTEHLTIWLTHPRWYLISQGTLIMGALMPHQLTWVPSLGLLARCCSKVPSGGALALSCEKPTMLKPASSFDQCPNFDLSSSLQDRLACETRRRVTILEFGVLCRSAIA